MPDRVEGPKRPKRRGSFGEYAGMGTYKPPEKSEVEEFEQTLDQLEDFFKQEKVENLRMRRASGARLQDFAEGLEKLKIEVEPELKEGTRGNIAPPVKAKAVFSKTTIRRSSRMLQDAADEVARDLEGDASPGAGASPLPAYRQVEEEAKVFQQAEVMLERRSSLQGTMESLMSLAKTEQLLKSEAGRPARVRRSSSDRLVDERTVGIGQMKRWASEVLKSEPMPVLDTLARKVADERRTSLDRRPTTTSSSGLSSCGDAGDPLDGRLRSSTDPAPYVDSGPDMLLSDALQRRGRRASRGSRGSFSSLDSRDSERSANRHASPDRSERAARRQQRASRLVGAPAPGGPPKRRSFDARRRGSRGSRELQRPEPPSPVSPGAIVIPRASRLPTRS